MLSYGAAITSVGLGLATWIRRLSRAVAINVIAFVVLGIALPICFALLWQGVALGLWSRFGIQTYTVDWILSGVVVVSPFAASQATLGTLVYHSGSHRGPFWCFAFAWTILAWTIAVVIYWATRETFDRNLGRIPEAPEESSVGFFARSSTWRRSPSWILRRADIPQRAESNAAQAP